jgi:hypothetical protein
MVEGIKFLDGKTGLENRPCDSTVSPEMIYAASSPEAAPQVLPGRQRQEGMEFLEAWPDFG